MGLAVRHILSKEHLAAREWLENFTLSGFVELFWYLTNGQITYLMSENEVIPRLDDRQRIQLSKALSYILRHGAVKEKLKMTDDGYILVNDIVCFLSHVVGFWCGRTRTIISCIKRYLVE